MDTDLGPLTTGHDHGLDPEFGHDLPATPAWIGALHRRGIDAGNCQGVDLAHSGGDGGVDRGGLGAVGRRVCGVLDVGAGESLPIRGDHHRPDPEVGVRRICVLGGGSRLQQPVLLGS